MAVAILLNVLLAAVASANVHAPQQANVAARYAGVPNVHARGASHKVVTVVETDCPEDNTEAVVTSTRVKTIIDCGPDVPDCPAEETSSAKPVCPGEGCDVPATVTATNTHVVCPGPECKEPPATATATATNTHVVCPGPECKEPVCPGPDCKEPACPPEGCQPPATATATNTATEVVCPPEGCQPPATATATNTATDVVCPPEGCQPPATATATNTATHVVCPPEGCVPPAPYNQTTSAYSSPSNFATSVTTTGGEHAPTSPPVAAGEMTRPYPGIYLGLAAVFIAVNWF